MHTILVNQKLNLFLFILELISTKTLRKWVRLKSTWSWTTSCRHSWMVGSSSPSSRSPSFPSRTRPPTWPWYLRKVPDSSKFIVSRRNEKRYFSEIWVNKFFYSGDPKSDHSKSWLFGGWILNGSTIQNSLNFFRIQNMSGFWNPTVIF